MSASRRSPRTLRRVTDGIRRALGRQAAANLTVATGRIPPRGRHTCARPIPVPPSKGSEGGCAGATEIRWRAASAPARSPRNSVSHITTRRSATRAQPHRERDLTVSSRERAQGSRRHRSDPDRARSPARLTRFARAIHLDTALRSTRDAGKHGRGSRCTCAARCAPRSWLAAQRVRELHVARRGLAHPAIEPRERHRAVREHRGSRRGAVLR